MLENWQLSRRTEPPRDRVGAPEMHGREEIDLGRSLRRDEAVATAIDVELLVREHGVEPGRPSKGQCDSR